ncbi:MAG: excinuclease ABC subunit UvrC, partial [Chloroflexi bacterium]|nr:excinuclease ABC subunit UvrC [Chloroflexota bacterium]
MNARDASTLERLKAAPERPGVYLFKDADARVLYVGKAARLRDRLRSYFGRGDGLPYKIQRMLQRATDFEFLVTASVSEALILENTLIKHHKPPYNTRLRDDKTYPYIKIDLKEEFPQVYFTRKVEQDGARYFGPFASAGSVRATLDLLKKLFPYRSCTKPITGKDPRPCLEYYLHRCVAPCVGYASKEEYREVISQVLLFLEGKTEAVLRQLKVQMEVAARGWKFERAAILRDQVRAIERIGEEQKVVSVRGGDLDVVAMDQDKDEAWVEVFFIRQGKLIGRDHFIMEGTQDEAPGHILADFVKQFYAQASFIPPQFLLQHPLEEAELIKDWLEKKRGGPVLLHVPRRGAKRKLVAMVAENASQGARLVRVRRQSSEDLLERGMRELQEALSLPRLPHRIECYDISNIHGTDAVGSLAVCQNGKPKPSDYRRFRIRSVEGIDDYAMMREMLKRRFQKSAQRQAVVVETGALDGQATAPAPVKMDAWGIIPDLVLIDGGRGHLSAALQVFLELGIGTDGIPLASIAKEREELFVPSVPEPVLLPRNSPALLLAQRARDEAHRFAVTYHQKLRSKRQVRSGLDEVPGIGPKRKRLILRRFGSLQAVKEASVDELASVPGVT